MITYVMQWAGRGQEQANDVLQRSAPYRRSGIRVFEFSPVRRTVWDALSLGYNPRADNDWGQITPTRVGTEAQIIAAVQECHRNGQLATVDLVDRQYGLMDGAPPYVDTDLDGKPDATIFPKGAGCFARPDGYDGELHFCPTPDTPWGTSAPADGLLAAYQHSEPTGWMLAQKCTSNRALMDRLGFDGHRRDEALSMWPGALHALFAVKRGFDVAEVFSGDPAVLDAFVREFGVPVIDFAYHYLCVAYSKGAPCTVLMHNAYADWNPSMARRIVENMDTDGKNGVVNNKLHCYLHGMTMPCRDFGIYAGDAEGYGLLPDILNYAWIGEKLCYGALTYVVAEPDLLAWVRDGDGGVIGQSTGVLCGFSRDPIHTQARWCWTPFGPNRRLHNYTVSSNGHDDIWTNADGWAYVPFPPNQYGSASNGVAYAPAGQDGAL